MKKFFGHMVMLLIGVPIVFFCVLGFALSIWGIVFVMWLESKSTGGSLTAKAVADVIMKTIRDFKP